MSKERAITYAIRSVVFLTATAFFAALQHFKELGWAALLLGLVLIPLPYLLLSWHQKTGYRFPLFLYVAVAVWIVFGFGLVNGLVDHALKIYVGHFLLPKTAYLWSAPEDFGSEALAILTAIASLYAAWFTFHFISAVSGNEAPGLSRVRRIGTFSGVALGVAVIVCASALYRQYEPRASGVVKIGVIVPLQGPAAILGNSFVKAVQLAAQDLGATHHTFKLVVVDSGTTPAQTVKATLKLIRQEKVQAIVGGISLSGQIVQRYADEAKVLHLCVCSVKTIGDGHYNFTNIPLPEDEAHRWFLEARERGIHSIAILTQDYPSINGHVQALREEAPVADVKIVFDQQVHAPGDHQKSQPQDFGALIEAAKQKNPDVYFVSAFPPLLEDLVRQLHSHGVTKIASIVAPSASADPALLDGAWYTDSNLAGSRLKSEAEQRFPDTRFVTHMMPYAYDSLKIVARAFESGSDPAHYVQQLKAYDGSAGQVTKDADSGNFRSRPAVWEIRAGKPVLVKP